MKPRQIVLVKSSYEALRGKHEHFADLFYDRLFELDPDTRLLFPPDMAGQKAILLKTMDAVVDCLGDTDWLLPVVAQLGQRHYGYGVQAWHYSSAGAAWYWALDKSLGDSFDDDTKLAWTAAFCALAKIMLDGGTPPDAPPQA